MRKNKLFALVLCLLLVFVLSGNLYAAAGKEDGDRGYLGEDRWAIRSDGDLEPIADSTYDIGQSGNEVAALYVDDIYGADSIIVDQINVGSDGGAGQAYYVNMTPGISAYATGTIVIFRAGTANTGACTIDVNGLGAKSVKKLNDQDPAADHIEAGQMVMAIYDYTSSVWEIIQPDSNP